MDRTPLIRAAVIRKCATCDTKTLHAYIRDDEARDLAEEWDHERQRQLVAGDAIVGNLRALGIRVYGERVWRREDMRITLMRWLDDGVFTVHIEQPNHPRLAAERLYLFEVVWHFMTDGGATGPHWTVFPTTTDQPPCALATWSLEYFRRNY